MHDTRAPAVEPNAAIAALPAYNAGLSIAQARRVSGRDEIAALASNENPYGASPAVADALARLNVARYSDPSCAALRAALGAQLGVAVDRIVCGNGSEELIAALSRAYLGPGDVALTVAPCFGLHEIEPLAAGARVVKAPMTADYGFDVDRLVVEIAKGPKIAFVSSPWNPVGAALDAAELKRVVDAVPHGTLLVLDEAYFELIDDTHPDGLAFLKAREDLAWVVLRTFSKAYGLAGLRVGYGVAADAEIARLMRAALTPFNVNAAAQAAACAALSDVAWMKDATARIRRDRATLDARLKAMGLKIAPSQTNFLFVNVARDAAAIAQALLARGVIVKPWKEKGYETFLRVSIGAAAENERFADELEALLNA